MKKHSIQALAALALLASCSSDDFIGGNGTPTQPTTSNAISFEGGTGKITRASQTGADAAGLLSEQFVVYGNKTVKEEGNEKTQTVYNRYNVDWVNNTTQSETNVHGWEYVGKGSNEKDNPQTIKYWDYSATQYNFVAWSIKGANTVTTGETSTTADPLKVEVKQLEDNKEYTEGYILTGKAEDLAKCYIADRVTAKNKIGEEGQDPKINNRRINYKEAVQFNFRKLETKVRIGLYETIPGYSVKDVKFYQSAETAASPETTPTLYAADKKIPNMDAKGTIEVTFGKGTSDGDFNKAMVKWTKDAKDSNADQSFISLNALNLINGEKKEDASGSTTNIYLGRTANQASLPTDYTSVIPAEVGVLTLKVDYTLVSTDGSGETINVKGATAQVPAQYTNWQPNYAYTYLFKITDKTNGSTGTDPDDPKGLYPIVFDAVVTETEDGIQNTITTVSTPSITTYQKGKLNSNDEEYKTGENIYVSVVGTGSNNTTETLDLYKEETNGENKTYTYYGKLYKLTQGTDITEAEAEKAAAETSLTYAGKTLTEEQASTSNNFDSRFADAIAADDAVDGVEVKGEKKFFKFTPEAGATYVFEYKKTEVEGENTTTTKAYKVIKVAAAQQTTGGEENQQGQN